jgi:hypothetical protein
MSWPSTNNPCLFECDLNTLEDAVLVIQGDGHHIAYQRTHSHSSGPLSSAQNSPHHRHADQDPLSDFHAGCHAVRIADRVTTILGGCHDKIVEGNLRVFPTV